MNMEDHLFFYEIKVPCRNAKNGQLMTNCRSLSYTVVFILTSVLLVYFKSHTCMLKAIHRDRNHTLPNQGDHKWNFEGIIHSVKCEELAFPYTCWTCYGSKDSQRICPCCTTGSSFILQFITTRALGNLFWGNSEPPVLARPDLFHAASCAC